MVLVLEWNYLNNLGLVMEDKLCTYNSNYHITFCLQAGSVQCVASLAWPCSSGEGGEGEREEEGAAEKKGRLMADRLPALKTWH